MHGRDHSNVCVGRIRALVGRYPVKIYIRVCSSELQSVAVSYSINTSATCSFVCLCVCVCAGVCMVVCVPWSYACTSPPRYAVTIYIYVCIELFLYIYLIRMFIYIWYVSMAATIRMCALVCMH